MWEIFFLLSFCCFVCAFLLCLSIVSNVIVFCSADASTDKTVTIIIVAVCVLVLVLVVTAVVIYRVKKGELLSF